MKTETILGSLHIIRNALVKADRMVADRNGRAFSLGETRRMREELSTAYRVLDKMEEECLINQ